MVRGYIELTRRKASLFFCFRQDLNESVKKTRLGLARFQRLTDLAFIRDGELNEFFLCGADVTACVKSTACYIIKAPYIVHVLSDCITSFDLTKFYEMLGYWWKIGCDVAPLSDHIEG